MQAPEFSVIIVNYNGGEYVCEAVRSLAAQTIRNFEVIVLDNASTDGSTEKIDFSGVPSAQLIRHEENLGFAAANNAGARMANGRWLALLNPDAVAEPDWLENVIAATRRYPDCRVFASAQYDLVHPELIDGAGDAYLVFGIPWRGGFGHTASHMPGEGECFSPCGAAAIYDRGLFLAHGGFDERYFCYCEDSDLGFRMQREGERCVFLPDAIVHHAGSAISGRHSAFSAYHGTRNRIWTYIKNMPLPLLLPTLPVHIALSVYLIFRSILTGCFLPTLRGTRDGICGLPGLMADPRWRQKDLKIPVWSLARKMAWNPLTLNRRAPDVRPMEAPAPPVTIKAQEVV
ncbi:MAG: glycosyltransferase family 2 protein [Hyphomonas sp.]